MSRTRALCTLGLRSFHSTVSLPKQQDVSPAAQARHLAMENLIDDVENLPSTNRNSNVAFARTEAQAPNEIFDAWNPKSFYAPLAFLRSRRIRTPPKRKNPPEVGPGAVEAAFKDPFRQLDISPVYEANNDFLLSGFLTSMGRILPRAQTRLSWRSQRKITQAIKRSRQKGVLPITHKPRLGTTM